MVGGEHQAGPPVGDLRQTPIHEHAARLRHVRCPVDNGVNADK